MSIDRPKNLPVYCLKCGAKASPASFPDEPLCEAHLTEEKANDPKTTKEPTLRYWVEELFAVGPDDAEWDVESDWENLDLAIAHAKTLIKPTEHGDSGVRVWDAKLDKVVWDNVGSKPGEPLTCWGDPETKHKEE